MSPCLLSRALACVSLPALFAAAPTLAATYDAQSRIETVIVYPDAANVSRVADVDLPAGTHALIFRGLPLNIDPASLRVEGEADGGLAIGSVEARVAPAENPQIDTSILEQLRSLRSDRDALQTRIETLDVKREMIRRYAQASPEKLGEDSSPLDIEKWSSAWDVVGSAIGKVNEDIRQGRADLREFDDRIRALEGSNRPGDGRARPLREVTVAVEAAGALKGRIVLTYRIAGASWRPIYDAKLATDAKGGKAALELVRRAQVSQRTGEDWKGVSLTVSTARVNRGVKAPDLETQRLSFWEPPPPPVVMRNAPMPRGAAAQAPAAESQPFAADMTSSERRKVEETQATLEAGAFEAAFRIPGRIDVQGDGAQRSLRIGAQTLDADVLIRATPAVDQTAYLDVSFVNDVEAPLLPGEVSIQRDNAYVGRGRMALTAQGETARLGFGADDKVKITRAPVRRRENEPTWLGSTKTETREFRTVVRNLHDFPVKVNIIDRIPISENSAIVIEQLAATPPPTDRIVDDKRGVMGWTFDLTAGASKEIKLAYRMKWPADRAVVFETVPNAPGEPIRPLQAR